MIERLKVFPTPSAGETVYGAICRLSNRFPIPGESLMGMLAGYRKGILYSCFGLPPFLPRMATVVPANNKFANVELALSEHTAVPYYLFGATENQRSNAMKSLVRSDCHSVNVILGRTKAKVPNPPALRFCPQCVILDRKYGVETYHVAHQLPTTFYCSKHNSLLVDACRRCGQFPISRKPFGLPGNCRCSSPDFLHCIHPEPDEVEPLRWLAVAGDQLISHYARSPRDPLGRLRSKALLSLGGFKTISSRKLGELIVTRFGRRVLSRLGLDIDNSGYAWPNLLVCRGRDSNSKPEPAKFLLILGALYEDVDAFLNDDKSHHYTTRPHGIRARAITKQPQKLEHHRALCRQYIKDYPESRRADLMRDRHTTYSYLTMHDVHLLNSLFPVLGQAARVVQCRAPLIDREVDDHRIAELFNSWRENELETTDKPLRISRARFLHSTSINSRMQRHESSYPRTNAAFEVGCETDDAWYARKIGWGATECVRRGLPFSPDSVRLVSGVSIRRATLYWKHALAAVDGKCERDVETDSLCAAD